MDIDISKVIASMKGVAGTGNVLSQAIKNSTDFLSTLEPGDIVRSQPPMASAAPIAYDLWYLWTHMNLMRKYYDDIDGDHFDYNPYVALNLGFLNRLTGLKPLKALRDLDKHLIGTIDPDQVFWDLHTQWNNNGVYWINLIAFENWVNGQGMKYPSAGPSGFDANQYVGYLTFPVGQLGVMEVISLIQESKLSGYKFAGISKKDPDPLEDKDIPVSQSSPKIFPDVKDSGMSYCYGEHMIDKAYLKSQLLRVELLSTNNPDYGEDVKPKFWMRYWIPKYATLPVPGEFIGILCKPVTTPPHVWWFQESSPFLYSGNWVEVGNVTSGIVTSITLEVNRTDGKFGNQYKIKVQGCEITVDASDFLEYVVGDRVAVVKVDSISKSATSSFTWLNQPTLKDKDSSTKKDNYIIIPITFYLS